MPGLTKQTILQKFYVYDPGVNEGDELGGLRVISDDGGAHVLATLPMVQYWIDQGLLGSESLDKLGDKSKKLLAQITRGRSEDNDTRPTRVPRYNKATQSGERAFAATPASSAARQRAKAQAAKNKKNGDKVAKKQTRKEGEGSILGIPGGSR